MKINFLHITFFIAIIIFGFSFSNKKFSDPNKEKLLIEVVKYVVEKGHYNSIEIDDDISEKIFDSYIEQLDAQKRFFLQSDIRQFEKYKHKLDDQLIEYDLTFFDLVFQTSRERIDEVKDYYYDIMENGFDFSSNESIDLDGPAEKIKIRYVTAGLDNSLLKQAIKQLAATYYENRNDFVEGKTHNLVPSDTRDILNSYKNMYI